MFEAGGEQISDTWTERHEAVFAELAAAHFDQLTLNIDVADSQVAYLSGS